MTGHAYHKRKNKKARIALEFAIGIVISILILVAILNIVSKLFRTTDASKDSFYNLVEEIKSFTNKNPGTLETTVLRMDKETVIIGFTKDDKPSSFFNVESYAQGAHLANYDFDKPVGFGCEEKKACICLYRDLYKDDGKLKFKEKSLICEPLDNIEFPNLPQENLFYYQGNGFVISNSEYFTEKEKNLQFRKVYIEKYTGPDGEIVAVCEEKDLKDGSCISESYKKESQGADGLKKLAEFIEDCINEKFSGEPCSCGAFDFKSNIPIEDSFRYSVKFINKDNKLILELEKPVDITLSSIEIETSISECKLRYNNENPIEKKESIEEFFVHRDWSDPFITPEKYVIYYGNEKDPQIAFIKYDENNICIVYADKENTEIIVGSSEKNSNILISKLKYVGPGEPEPIEIMDCEEISTANNLNS
ncbi:MAG: hypothetical protein PHV16_01275 [Candidatus Nanoarchaeia archaeon]|nr:hypothetical protein [Candidatus Nanoarchaeia archaeon]